MKPVSLFLLIAISLLLAGCAQNQQNPQGAPPAAQNAVNNAANGGSSMAKNVTSAADTAQAGDTVQVDYIGKLQNGTLFDTSIEAEAKNAGLPLRPSYAPLEFTVGAGQMIAGFDAAVVGMKVGEEKNVTLPPSQAYGDWSADKVITINVSDIGNSANISVGSVLYASNGASGRVVALENGTAKVDFNPELAGKTLVFTIRMVSIKKA
jgi:FKBP-type peptidyl-prolyl cis-trans isomerase 2